MITQHGGHTQDMSLSRGLNPDNALDLSASLHPVAPNVVDVLKGNLKSVRNYPDDRVATQKMAKVLCVDPDRLLLTNGGSEAIALVAKMMQVGNVTAPEFSLYERYLSKVDEAGPIWRSNPNNPMGTLAKSSDQAAVWDEAFYPVATAQWTRGDDSAWRIGSLTKIWACAGLRLGYVVAPDEKSKEIISFQKPKWSVNSLALSIVEPMLEMTDLVVMRDELEILRANLFAVFEERNIPVQVTEANWLLIYESSRLFEHLANKNIFIRNCESFGLFGTYRVAIPNKASIDRVRAALRDYEVENE